MSERNPALSDVQDILGAMAAQLQAAKAEASEPEVIIAINNELIEINHRITMVGAVLFHRQTAAITAAAAKVSAAKADVEAEIRRLDKINTFIRTIAGFLGLVDRVIDLAKLGRP